MALTGSGVSSLKRKIAQWEAIHGRQIDPSVLKSYLSAEIEVESGRQAQRSALEMQKTGQEAQIAASTRGMDISEKQFEVNTGLRREEAEAAKSAAKTAGMVQAGETALLYDVASGGKLSSGLSSAVSGIANRLGYQAGTGLGSGSTTISTTAVPAGQAAIAGAGVGTVGAGYGGMAAVTGSSSAVLGGTPVFTGVSQAAPTMGPLAGGSTAAGGAGAGAGAGGTTVGGSTAAGGASAGAGGASAGAGGAAGGIGGTGYSAVGAGTTVVAGAAVGRTVASLAFQNDSTAKDVGTIGGGAAAGAYIGSAVGPVGTAVGAVAGAVVGVVVDVLSDAGGSVICRELHRQGMLSDEVLLLDGVHRMRYVDDETYAGYRRWADHLVRWMRSSKVITWLVAPFAMSWAIEMASKVSGNYGSNWLGRQMLRFGGPLCKWLGRGRVK